MKKEFRIKKTTEIESIIKKRKFIANKYFIIYKDINETNNFRFAISVPKKYGNAVSRNKMKRRLREIIRKNKSKISIVDFFIIVKKEANVLNFQEIENNILELLTMSKILIEVKNE